MNHLPVPIDGNRPIIPFNAVLQNYEPDTFYEFPKALLTLHGYEDFHELMEEGLKPNIKGGEANEFLQSWLFFTLLAQVTNQVIRPEHFRDEDGHLHTRNLRSIIEKWETTEKQLGQDYQTMSKFDRDKRVSRYFRASHVIADARRFVSKHLSYERLERVPKFEYGDDTRDERGIDKRITLSLAILGETLQEERARVDAFGISEIVEQPRRFWRGDSEERVRRWGYSKYCRDLMVSRGMCPLQIRRIEGIMPSVKAVYYTSSIKHKVPDHNKEKCTVDFCGDKSKKIDPVHVNGCTGCSCKHVKEEELSNIIQDGRIPMLKWSSGSLRCVGYDLNDRKVPYGILSHSWGDGIVGSALNIQDQNDSAMQSCQLDSLHTIFRRIIKEQDKKDEKVSKEIRKHFKDSQEIYFWVDIACLPQKQRALKAKVLNRMGDLFQNASAVLIWDRALLAEKMPPDTFEINARIQTGDWSWRLWTFQEAIIAPEGRLYIGFYGDRYLNMEEIGDQQDEAMKDRDNTHHFIWQSGYPFSHPMYKLRQNADNRAELAWQAIQYRQVSRPEDETIVLANVLKLDVTEILKMEVNPKDLAVCRMAKLIDMLNEEPTLGVPPGIIFLPSPGLNKEGYTWAPSSWLTKQSHHYALFRPLRTTATILNHGLLVKFPSISLLCPPKSLEAPIFRLPVHQLMHKWYKVVIEVDKTNWKGFWSDVIKNEDLHIIMCNPNPTDRYELGLLVAGKGRLRKNSIRWVKRLARVWIRLEDNLRLADDESSRYRESGGELMFGERSSDAQEWCIDGSIESLDERYS